MSLPSFQHGVGDPVEDDIRVAPHHTLVLVEGNYLLLGSTSTLLSLLISGCHCLRRTTPSSWWRATACCWAGLHVC